MWGAIRAQECMRSCSTVPHTLNRANDSSQALSSYEYAAFHLLARERNKRASDHVKKLGLLARRMCKLAAGWTEPRTAHLNNTS